MILTFWRSLFSVMGYAMWNDRLAVVLTLTFSSACSLSQLRRFSPVRSGDPAGRDLRPSCF